MELVGGQSLKPHRGIGPIRPDAEVLPYARLQVEIGVDRTRIERLHFRMLHVAAEAAFAFALDPQPIDVAAEEGFAVPAIAIRAVAHLNLGKVEEYLAVTLATALLHHRMVAARHVLGRKEAVGVAVARDGRRRRIAGGQVGADRPRRIGRGHRHLVAGVRVCGRRVVLDGSRGGGRHLVPAMVLGKRRSAGEGRERRPRKHTDHAASPAGRTLTTRIMPDAM